MVKLAKRIARAFFHKDIPPFLLVKILILLSVCLQIISFIYPLHLFKRIRESKADTEKDKSKKSPIHFESDLMHIRRILR